MSHTIVVTVTATVDRESGKFAGRDELEAAIVEAVEGADPGSISGVGVDGDSEYAISAWEVSA